MNAHSGTDPRLDPQTHAGMRALIGRLPEWQAQIEERVVRDRAFREICRTYHELTQAITERRQRASAQAERCIKDYEMLLRELEAEALFSLWAGIRR